MAYQVIPEGTSVVISFEPTAIAAGDSVILNLSKIGDDKSQASLSDNSITLSSEEPKDQIIVTVADNPDKQGDALTFTIAFTLNKGTLDGATPDLPQALTFTIPPNDLKVSYKEEPPAIITGTDQNLSLIHI